MHQAVRLIHDSAAVLRDEGPAGDLQGNLTDLTVKVLKDSGGVRLLQAKDLGGYEEHPNEFFDWAIEVGANQPSAGWIAGIVGVHPWEISMMHPRLQEEIFGDDPDTWTASPYAPFGRAVAVDGGFLLSGDWPYSTGTDFCDWVILGGIVTGPDGSIGAPPDVRHFVLPRADYEIVEDSWNVMGLKGTGSKNVRMSDVFVPDYRVAEGWKMVEGVYADERRPGNPLYGMMFGLVFSSAIAAGTLGIAEGTLRAHRQYMENRVSIQGQAAKSDPAYLVALARAESDLAASKCHFKTMVAELYDHVAAGNKPTPAQRLRFRRDQVRATDRVFESITPLARLAGSAGIQEANRLEQHWRDLQVGITHVCNVREPAYIGWGVHAFGGDIPPMTLY
jgi:3-hydroxy-9,10-secoandrosta-1,3,5(10)-triene-9,17-dione monooxygenase